jgi:DNA invertase Pin-like site-specific DNA recombinase
VSTRQAIAYIPESSSALASAARISAEIPPVLRIELVGAVGEPHAGDGRAGVSQALERIALGEATVLLVARLADAVRSLRELFGLLDWLDAAEGHLVALDVSLDTASPGGRRTVATLREVARWHEEPPPGRRPRGRPGVAAVAPELTERIAAMRREGLSLQAIADQLDADGTPTPRGGARWRPSSVQTALGYRRPRPPLPGAPPPPAPPPPRGGPTRGRRDPGPRSGRPPTPRPPGRRGPP